MVTSSFQSFDKSPLGAFIQSTLKVRNNPGGTAFVMHVCKVSDHYAFFPTFVDWPVDVDSWEDQTIEEEVDAEGFLLVVAEPSTLAEVTDAPPPVPTDHLVDFTGLPEDYTLATWKTLFQVLTLAYGTPPAVVIAFALSEMEGDAVDDYAALQEFEDFLFDDLGIPECVVSYVGEGFGGRWLSFDQVFRNNSLNETFPILVADFEAAVFEGRCRGFPPNWV